MPIAVDLIYSNLKVKPLQGPSFKEHRDIVLGLKGKMPHYGMEGKDYKLLFWEVPRSELGSLVSQIDSSQMVFQSEKAKHLILRYEDLLTPIDKLPKITREIIWHRPVKFDCQEGYIRSPETRNRLILAFDPGLGKSFTSLMRASVLGFGNLLIVVPNSIIKNWESEVYKTNGNVDGLLIYHGTPTKRQKLRDQLSSARIIITTYTMIKELENRQFDQIIFDEGQMLANPKSKKRKSAKRLANNNLEAGMQILSGTYIQHKPRDLWSLVDIIYPELAGDFSDWKDRYEKVLKTFIKHIQQYARDGSPLIDADGKPITRKLEIPWIVVPQNLDELHERVKPYTYRVKRDGLVNFDEEIEITRVPLVGKQKMMYQSAVNGLLLELENDKYLSVPNLLSRLTRLRQIGDGAFTLEPNWKDSGKIDYAAEIFKEIDDKLIIWSAFKATVKEMHSRFPKESVLFTGDLNPNQKALAIWAFQGVDNEHDLEEYTKLAKRYNWKLKPGEARGFFSTIDRSASLGYNLHSCWRQMALSFSWNGNVNEQAWARVKRPDQTSEKIYTEIVVSTEFEEQALALVLSNVKTCKHVMDGKGDISYRQIEGLIDVIKKDVA